MTKPIATVEGQPVRVGDFIGFKDDIEQNGKLVRVQGGYLVLSVYDSVTGDRHEVYQHPSHCWVE